jgi:hypothetical protein
MEVWENEDARRRESGDVWLIECKEACPNVGGEKRRQQARWHVRRGRPAERERCRYQRRI